MSYLVFYIHFILCQHCLFIFANNYLVEKSKSLTSSPLFLNVTNHGELAVRFNVYYGHGSIDQIQ